MRRTGCRYRHRFAFEDSWVPVSIARINQCGDFFTSHCGANERRLFTLISFRAVESVVQFEAFRRRCQGLQHGFTTGVREFSSHHCRFKGSRGNDFIRIHARNSDGIHSGGVRFEFKLDSTIRHRQTFVARLDRPGADATNLEVKDAIVRVDFVTVGVNELQAQQPAFAGFPLV